MKKKDVVRALKQLGFRMEREGASHEIWSGHGVSIPLGRHREIPEMTAKGILRAAKEAKHKES